MDYNISTREKDKGIQAIISYKVENKWKQKSKQGFKKHSEAKRWAQKEVRELEKLNLTNTDYLDLNFNQLSNLFLESVNNKYSANTLKSYKTTLNHFAEINNKKYTQITSFDLQKIIDNLDVTNISKIVYLKNIKAIFNFAINKLETLVKNPTNKVEINKGINRKYLVVTKEEFYKDIFPKLNEGREEISLIYKIAFSTGLRAGEILGLTYDCIKSDKIIINKQWGFVSESKRGFKKTKTTNSNREVPISPKLYESINVFKTNNLHISTRLFHMVNKSETISAAFNKIFNNTKYENLRLHDMRHSYVSALISQGLDFKTISELIGNTVEVTMNTYSHVNTNLAEKAKEIIVNYF